MQGADGCRQLDRQASGRCRTRAYCAAPLHKIYFPLIGFRSCSGAGAARLIWPPRPTSLSLLQSVWVVALCGLVLQEVGRASRATRAVGLLSLHSPFTQRRRASPTSRRLPAEHVFHPVDAAVNLAPRDVPSLPRPTGKSPRTHPPFQI
jgi:hypothetical protein